MDSPLAQTLHRKPILISFCMETSITTPRCAGVLLLATTALSGAAMANTGNEILVSSNITTSTTWTANNCYNLQQQIFVMPGATLTIEAGTVIASTTNLGGSLAVTNGAQIFVQGTATEPVIMTSTADVATWVNGDPRTGTWRASAQEWGNLTIMGGAYISEDAVSGNTPAPNANNRGVMEGLVAAFPGDTTVLYGGGDDDYDAGSLRYLSLRYGGNVIGLTNELNGLSLGGVGRGTDFSHVEIMNNVDDGIEIWGGTINLQYFSIWNIGDDSLDIDQGWRGKAQFGLIVQGYSILNANQGSGLGDNAIETDGAEDSDWQPVTTASMYNLTVIGQPLSGDNGTAWRDNARVQYANCIFMDLGRELVQNDGDDGDGASGYGHNGTLSFAQTWATPFNQTSPVNAPANPASFYQSQVSGNLAQITDSVFFRNLDLQGDGDAYAEANNVGVFNASNNNVLIPGFDEDDSPIQSITRGAAVTFSNNDIQLPVIGLDPTPAGPAINSVGEAPDDGFFRQAGYRGAFAPDDNWLENWTAAAAFGFTSQSDSIGEIYCAPANVNSTGLSGTISANGSDIRADNDVTLNVSNLPSGVLGLFVTSMTEGFLPNPAGSGGNLCVLGNIGRYNNAGQPFITSAAGQGSLGINLGATPTPTGTVSVVAGQTWVFQAWYRGVGPGTNNFTDAVSILFQ